MSLSDEYRRQFGWRDWPTILDALPSLEGQTVIDLGCGVGDLAAALVERGARVVGCDLNEELLHTARSRHITNAEFLTADLRALPDLGVAADGIWCSFVAAYFTDLPPLLAAWGKTLKPGGWIALTEIDDLFGHEPLSGPTKALLSAYADEALASGLYDFHMGRKLQGYLEAAGYTIVRTLTPRDQEFSFDGPASHAVLDGWRDRFDRMKRLRDFCGGEIGRVQEEFLGCLLREDHHATAKVHCCIATKRGPG